MNSTLKKEYHTNLYKETCKHCGKETWSTDNVIYDKGCWHVACYRKLNPLYAKKQ